MLIFLNMLLWERDLKNEKQVLNTNAYSFWYSSAKFYWSDF